MRNIYFRIFLIFALPLLFLAMGADTGGLSGSGSCVSSNRSSSDIGEGTDVEFVISLSQDNCCRAVIKGTVPDIEDLPYAQGELRVIADGGDFENPLVKITVTGITSGMQIRETIPGLMPNTLYKAKFFALDEDANAFVAFSNEAPLDTTFKTIKTQAFGHSWGFYMDKMQAADGIHWNFLASFSGDRTQGDQVGILVTDADSLPADNESVFAINPFSNPANDLDYNFLAAFSVDKALTIVCDPAWGKQGSLYERTGKCYIFINESDILQTMSVEDADMQLFFEDLIHTETRLGNSFSYDPATKTFLASIEGASCPVTNLPDCGMIGAVTLDLENKTFYAQRIVQVGAQTEDKLGFQTMGDYDNNGVADIALVATVDRFHNNSMCRQLKYCMNSFDCDGAILAQFSAPWCAPEQGAQAFFWLNGTWKDYNKDGFDDVAFLTTFILPEIKSLLNIWWGGPNGLDPENVFQLGADITDDGGWRPEVGDINGDGINDLAIIGLRSMYVYLNQDIESEPVIIELQEAIGAMIADIDNDGYADLIGTNIISGSIADFGQLDPDFEFSYFTVSR